LKAARTQRVALDRKAARLGMLMLDINGTQLARKNLEQLDG